MTKPSRNQSCGSNPKSCSLKSRHFKGIRMRKWVSGTKAKLNFPHSPPKISCASFLSPQQIQTAAAKFAAEECRLLSENGEASSSYGSEEECDINSEQIIWEEGATFGDSVAFESMENGGSFNVEDIPPLEGLMEDFGIPFQLPEDWELGIF
eukprot:PITA_18688